MNDDRVRDESPLSEKKETSGEYLFRVLKPAGCLIVLVVLVLFFVTCFTHKSDPVKDYTPPQSAEYYAADPAALAAELNRSLLKILGGTARVENGTVVITAPAEKLEQIRAAVCAVFDEKLLSFAEG